jgi:hypothetical protein
VFPVWAFPAGCLLSLITLQNVQAMEVNVVAGDKNGDMVLKSGELSTPAGLSGAISSKTLETLSGHGIGPIFGSLTFAEVKPHPVVPAPPAPALPSLVPTSLQLVSEPAPISTGLAYGLRYGGISIAPGVIPPGTRPTSPGNQVSGHFELDGTVGTLKATRLSAVATPKLVPNPLPGTAGFFVTGLGAGIGILRLFHRRRRTEV